MSLMQRVMMPSMGAAIEGTTGERRCTRLNGASGVVGGYKCMGMTTKLGTGPAHGPCHAGPYALLLPAMCPAPSPHPGA
jgi:hypothetical protein